MIILKAAGTLNEHKPWINGLCYLKPGRVEKKNLQIKLQENYTQKEALKSFPGVVKATSKF